MHGAAFERGPARTRTRRPLASIGGSNAIPLSRYEARYYVGSAMVPRTFSVGTEAPNLRGLHPLRILSMRLGRRRKASARSTEYFDIFAERINCGYSPCRGQFDNRRSTGEVLGFIGYHERTCSIFARPVCGQPRHLRVTVLNEVTIGAT
jgi:hypothetical protein